jgi:hypothetical protein
MRSRDVIRSKTTNAIFTGPPIFRLHNLTTCVSRVNLVAWTRQGNVSAYRFPGLPPGEEPQPLSLKWVGLVMKTYPHRLAASITVGHPRQSRRVTPWTGAGQRRLCRGCGITHVTGCNPWLAELHLARGGGGKRNIEAHTDICSPASGSFLRSHGWPRPDPLGAGSCRPSPLLVISNMSLSIAPTG